MKNVFSILLHLYYPDSWETLFKKLLTDIGHYHFHLFINCTIDVYDKTLIHSIKEKFPHAYIIESPNTGKDIGGKLALIDLYLKLKMEDSYLVLLHDKRSPHATTGDQWRERLFRIVNPYKVNHILKLFDNDKTIGLIGSKECIMNEFDEKETAFKTTNHKILNQLKEKHQLLVPNHSFIGGTMFWIRSSLIKSFFGVYPPLACREFLEPGNVMDIEEGTYTHAWERILCWIATSKNYKIRGV